LGPYLQKDINNLEKIQRKAARFVTNNHIHTDNFHPIETLEWPTLQDRRKLQRLHMFSKIINDQTRLVKEHYLKENTSRRKGITYSHIRCNTEMYNNSYFPRTIRDWNNQPPNLD
jgi:hypothetical protein